MCDKEIIMERIVTYKSFDGRIFHTESDCCEYEKILRETYDKVIENIELYDDCYEKVDPMTIEMFYAGEDMSYEIEDQLDTLLHNITIMKINKDYFDFCRNELNNWFERIGYPFPISPEKSKYDYYIYTGKNFNDAFIPIDGKIAEASALIKLVLKGKLL